MPVKDVDGGLVWNNYNYHIATGKLPKDQYASLPFYFGGSQVPVVKQAEQRMKSHKPKQPMHIGKTRIYI